MSTIKYVQHQIINNRENDEGIAMSFGRKEQIARSEMRAEAARVVDPNVVAKKFKNLGWLSQRSSK